MLSATQSDPVLFDTAILGRDPWSTSRQIMQAIATPRARVAVKGCHASGKTWTAAGVVLWWVSTGGIAITTAPSGTQVKLGLWPEIHRAYQGARVNLGGALMQKEWRISPDIYAIGFSTDQGVRFQGFHGRILIVLDEAPGVLAEIWPAISGIRAGGDVRLLTLGNPVIASGPFYEAFTSQREFWQTVTIDAFDTPNLAGLTPADLLTLSPAELAYAPRPYLATREWAKEMLQELGEDSPEWQSRVRGQFPEQSPDSLISLAWLEGARLRSIDEVPAPIDGLWAGLDVAGPGESETVLAIRQGGTLLSLQSWPSEDPRGAVVAALAPYKEKAVHINVDSIGQGYYMARHLEDQGYKGRVHDVNVGAAARDVKKYANAKAEHYWGLRQWLQQGHVAGLTDERTIGQLAGIRYHHTPRGQVQIESKDEARRRGVKSPDRAEAVMLCFASHAGRVFRAASAGERPVLADYQQQQANGGGRAGWPGQPARQAPPRPR